mgnify:CR=1 FL=1
MLRKTPKPFNAVNVVFRLFVHETLFVLHAVMFAPTFERIVAPKLVRKVHRPLSRFLPDDSHQFLGGHSLHHPRIHPPVALQKAEYNAFTPRTSSPFPLASAAEVALVKLNLARQFAALKFGHVVDRFAQTLVHPRNRLVAYVKIMGQFVCRLQLVEALQYRNFSDELPQRLLFSTPAVSTPNVSATGSVSFERTAENTLPAPHKVGRTPENVLLSFRHMDILTPYGYDYH